MTTKQDQEAAQLRKAVERERGVAEAAQSEAACLRQALDGERKAVRTLRRDLERQLKAVREAEATRATQLLQQLRDKLTLEQAEAVQNEREAAIRSTSAELQRLHQSQEIELRREFGRKEEELRKQLRDALAHGRQLEAIAHTSSASSDNPTPAKPATASCPEILALRALNKRLETRVQELEEAERRNADTVRSQYEEHAMREAEQERTTRRETHLLLEKLKIRDRSIEHLEKEITVLKGRLDDSRNVRDRFDLEKMNKTSRCQLTVDSDGKFVVLDDAFNSCLRTLFYNNRGSSNPAKDFHSLLNSLEDQILDAITQECITYGAIKFNLVLEATYVKSTLDEQNQEAEEFQDVAFKTPNYAIYNISEVAELVKTACQKMLEEELKFEGKSSGWTLLVIDGLLIRISRNTPLRGSSFIELPPKIAARKAIINPKNQDQECFKWAMLAKHIQGKDPQRINERYHQFADKYNFTGITFPTTINQLDRFEINNPGVSVNVYGVDTDNIIFPRRVVKEVKADHTDLLLLCESETSEDSEEKEEADDFSVKTHYCYIKNFEKLLRSQLSKDGHKIVICRRCFTHYTHRNDGERRLREHEEYCANNKTARIIMPQPEKDGSAPTMKFKNHLNKFRLPLVAYADFECILEKPDDTTEQWIGKATKVIQYHKAMSYCLYFVKDEQQYPSTPFIKNLIPQEPIVYRGPDAAEHFMKTLTEHAREFSRVVDDNCEGMYPLTDQQKAKYDTTDFCEACNKKFDGDKVRDHCHITGVYRNALCNSCNLKRHRQTFIPVFLHNSSNYDTHLIIPHLGTDVSKLSVIPNSSEKYISFTKQISNRLHLRFIDTFRFTPDSLDNLVTNLVKSANDDDLSRVLPHTAREFTNNLNIVSRKGVFPYEYCDSWEKLEETALPPKEAFFSQLTNSDISDEAYAHAQNVWRHFGCRTLGEYSDLYLKTDVLLLADVFESFRDVCMKTYDLDCAHYFTSPGLSFDVMLKYTKVELELLTDYDMYMFVERGIRGGITTCVHRHALANNKYTGAPMDPEKPTSYLLYTDANNLYGWAMCQPLPCRNFQWMERQHLESVAESIETIPEDLETGFILEVDIEYPPELHDDHNDFPFLAENQKTPKSGSIRLMTTLNNREHYVCHFRTLKQAVKHGLRITKVHRGIKFEQKDFLKPYIMLNTELRQQSKNKFEKNFFKLMNNSVFGKTMENVRKRMNMELVNDKKRLKKLIARPTFKDRIIFGENICAVTLHKDKVALDKPIYIGLTVLDVSKTLMYHFHYDIMKPTYKEKLQLLYQDTDSLFYLVKTEDMYKDIISIQQLKDVFDTSEYPADHPCYSETNKMVLGKFKDEYAGRAPLEYVGLQSKLYACRCYNTDPSQLKSGLIKKAKGVRRPVLGQELSKSHPDAGKYISFQDYLECLFQGEDIYRDQVSFTTRKHQIMTQLQKKKALSNADEKRYILEDGIQTLAYGHCKIPNLNEENECEESDNIRNAEITISSDDDDDSCPPAAKRPRVSSH